MADEAISAAASDRSAAQQAGADAAEAQAATSDWPTEEWMRGGLVQIGVALPHGSEGTLSLRFSWHGSGFFIDAAGHVLTDEHVRSQCREKNRDREQAGYPGGFIVFAPSETITCEVRRTGGSAGRPTCLRAPTIGILKMLADPRKWFGAGLVLRHTPPRSAGAARRARHDGA